MTPLQFESAYRPLWDELEEAIERIEGSARRGKKKDGTDAGKKPLDAARVAALYRSACEHLALARSRAYPIHLTERLDDLTHRGHQIVYRQPSGGLGRLRRLLLVDIPQSVRDHRLEMWIMTAVFVIPTVVLGLLSYFDPGFILTMHDASSVRDYERMYDGAENRFGRPRNADTDWQMFGFYIMNNIGVSFRCFAGGIFLGLGSLFFVGYNGALAGTVAGFLTVRGHGENFYSFVVTHGAFELTAIVISGAAGLALGRALLMPGRLTRLQALKKAATDAVPMMYGVIAMLVIAAAVEAFWSSARWVAPQVKYGVGAACWVLVLAYLGWQGRARRVEVPHAG